MICWTGKLSSGSGFFVNTNKIATNIHNIDKSGPVFVKLINNDSIWEVEEVTAFDIKNDLVVLQLSGEGTPLPLGDSDTVKIGEPVITVGYPNGKYRVTKGKVHEIRNRDEWIVTTPKTFPGNSGGPLLNDKGQVIGINTRANKYNFAVPSNILKALLARSVSPESLAQWQKRDQIRAYAYYGEGEDKFNAGEYAKAIISFDNAILHNSKYIYAYNMRALAKYHLGQSKAEQGNITEAQQLYQTAIDDCTHSIKIDPKYTFPHFQRGLTRTALGRAKADQENITKAQQLYQAAIDDYTQAIQLFPKDALAHNNRGWVKYLIGKSKTEKGDIAEAGKLYQEAIDDYTQAIKIDPQHVLAHYNRGNAKKALGQSDEAEKDFAKAKELESDK